VSARAKVVPLHVRYPHEPKGLSTCFGGLIFCTTEHTGGRAER